jgi:hypothetical protein
MATQKLDNRRWRGGTTSVRLWLLLSALIPAGVHSSFIVASSLPSCMRHHHQGGMTIRMKNQPPDNGVSADAASPFFAQLQYFLGGGGGGGKNPPAASKNAEATMTATTSSASIAPPPVDTNKHETKKPSLGEEVGSAVTRLVRTMVAKLRQGSILPALVAFWIGYKIGISRAVQAMADAVNPATRNGVPSPRTTLRTLVLVTALVALLVREFWRGVPFWIKRQLPRLLLPKQLAAKFMRSKAAVHQLRRDIDDIDDDDDNDDNNMTSLPTIMRKLKSLLDLGSEKLGLNKDKAVSTSDNIESSILVLLRLIRQIKMYRPDIRDAEFTVAYDDDHQSSQRENTIVTEYHQRMFELADAAYDELPHGLELRDFLYRTYGYELLRHEAIVVPGSVAHYIALNKTTKEAVIGVKGTSSLEDLLTDCCGVAVDYNGMRCHDGILTASKRLAADLETILVDLLIPRGYAVTLTGHSLVR